MAEAGTRLTRRTVLGAPVMLAQPIRPPAPPPARTLPAAPTGWIWVCVNEMAWLQLKAAQAILEGLDAAR